MKRILLLLGMYLCLGATPAFAWDIGNPPEYNLTYLERKIVRVFHQVQNGNESFAAFQLSNGGGTGVSKDAILVHDLSSPSGKAVYQRLLTAYEQGRSIIMARNDSRGAEAGNWFQITTFYRVYASDTFWTWIR